jgi:hypothetical protein
MQARPRAGPQAPDGAKARSPWPVTHDPVTATAEIPLGLLRQLTVMVACA